ncbi:hypothetical protein [Stenotrophomonas maltophilia]|uniref:hypothetical protein n=1 Tax=Stenotrophomonas maltophilia TaxID=40324 RepID=UPI0011B4877C|nr:hypothetical protein [Stenotrophomonas maltophilia]
MPIEWYTPVKYAARAAKAGYDNRHAIQSYWTRAKAHVDLGRTQILITGAPSAGKTILSGQMHGKARSLYYDNPGASLKVEVDAIKLGEWTKLVRVLPGQINLRTSGELEAFTGNDSLEGVIHVVNWGFSSPRDPAVQASLVGRDGIQNIDQLREYNKLVELEALRADLDNIRRLYHVHRRPKWMVVAVNKVDLFPGELSKALLYYHKDGVGPFASAVKSLETDLGAANFKVHTIQVCASEENFAYNGDVVVSGLERGAKDEMLRDFVNSVSYIADSNL